MCLLIRTLIPSDQGPNLITPFNFNYFLTPNTHCGGRGGGEERLSPQYENLRERWRHKIQPITNRIYSLYIIEEMHSDVIG